RGAQRDREAGDDAALRTRHTARRDYGRARFDQNQRRQGVHRKRSTKGEYGGQAREEQNLTSALRPGPDCPSIERLGRYADGALTPDERRREESPVGTGPTCQADRALLQAL